MSNYLVQQYRPLVLESQAWYRSLGLKLLLSGTALAVVMTAAIGYAGGI